MGTNRPKQLKGNYSAKSLIKDTKTADPVKDFRVRVPLLWLTLTALVTYIPTLSFRLTDFDDGIFINTFQDYNENAGNLLTSFKRGLFDPIKDTYYRPVFSDVMILNYQISDHGRNLGMYHAINILFHIVAVLLLFKLLTRLNVKALHAFILTMIFAVHPVLSMAVAWIPGRNDTLLAVFILAFLISVIDYSKNGKPLSLFLSGLFLILAYFTKETAIVAVPVGFVLIVFELRRNWCARRNIIQYGVWFCCFGIWFAARSFATIQTSNLKPAQMLHDFVHKLPLIIQYIGKIFLPFNLSVFPTLEDTVLYYGIIAIVIVSILIVLNKKRNTGLILCSAGIFLLFLLPVMIVPDSLNLQCFEHRLYLPMIGILMLMPQTVLFRNKLTDAHLLYGGMGICALLAVCNYNYVQNFSDPRSFWTQAVETSPHSAYANMMLAARTDNPDESKSLFLKAFKLNPKERYLNFIYGVMLQNKDSMLESEKYLLTEKANTCYYECDYYLARVAMEKKDFKGAIAYLENFIKKAPGNKTANDNLLLLYIDTDQMDKAKEQAVHMQKYGLELPPSVIKEFNL